MAVVAALAYLALAAWPAAPLRAQVMDSATIRELVEGLRSGTISSAYASSECSGSFADTPDSVETLQVLSTYLEVPAELAASAFCSALVHTIVRGDIGVESLLAINREEADAPLLHAAGRILRAVYFAHQRATTISAEAAATR